MKLDLEFNNIRESIKEDVLKTPRKNYEFQAGINGERSDQISRSPLPLIPVDVRKVTSRVDFGKTDSLKGPMTANACVEVYTSDGVEGTLTHLAIGTDTKTFAEDLRKLVGKAGVSVLLAGGDSHSNESYRLIKGLNGDLVEQGFNIIDTDLGGKCGRKSRMLKNRVELEIEDYQHTPPISRKKVLYFSK